MYVSVVGNKTDISELHDRKVYVPRNTMAVDERSIDVRAVNEKAPA